MFYRSTHRPLTVDRAHVEIDGHPGHTTARSEVMTSIRMELALEKVSSTDLPRSHSAPMLALTSRPAFNQSYSYMTQPDYPVLDSEAERLLGFYVYGLADPRTGEIFYVGKGRNDRWHSHIKSANQRGEEEETEKRARIREIEASGVAVQVWFLRSGFPLSAQGERIAFEVEAAIIDTLRLGNRLAPANVASLTNKVARHEAIGRSRLSLAQAAQLFIADPVGEIHEPVILLNLARTWHPEMSADELWEYTRNAWKCHGPRRANARFALPVSLGIIRAGYEISGWRYRQVGNRNWEDDRSEKKPRLIIESDHAPTPHPDMQKYVQRSVRDLVRQTQWSFTYVNC